MSDQRFPLLDDVIDTKSVTLYTLSDPNLRLRDPFAVVCLTRFCTWRNIQIDLRAVRASHRRNFDDSELTDLYLRTQDQTKIDDIIRDYVERGRAQEEEHRFGVFIGELFNEFDNLEQEKLKNEPPSETLVPRGPVIILGRPQFFPRWLTDEIDKEIRESGHGHTIAGRFRFVSDNPQKPEDFRLIRDNYSGLEIDTLLNSKRGIGQRDAENSLSDYGVVRKVAGPYANRNFIFVYGSSSLGSLAAAQLLIDPEFNMEFHKEKISRSMVDYGCVELMLRADRRGSHLAPLVREFDPRDIRIIGKPLAPVSEEAPKWAKWFAKPSGTPVNEGLYRYDSAGSDERTNKFEVTGLNPRSSLTEETDTPRVCQLVGGDLMRQVSDTLVEYARSDDVRVVTLIGPRGAGKELAARILYEERVARLLARLAKGDVLPESVKIGPRFVGVNTAAVVATLMEAQLFGTKDGFANDIRDSFGSILDAGEGVILLDEIEAMAKDLQAKLLRVVQPPYCVTPVGESGPVPFQALVVAATNEEPNELVAQKLLRADLFSRLRGNSVRIPPLKERPGDVPAILTYIAGRPLKIRQRVLHCLLADAYPDNVRELYAIIGRAFRRQEGGLDKQDGCLHIEMEDLGERIRYAFSGLLEEINPNIRDEDQLFYEFSVKSPSASHFMQYLFDQAGIILSSLKIKGKQVAVRTPTAKYDQIWWHSTPSAFNAGSVPECCLNYYELVDRVNFSFAQEADREMALDRLSDIFKLRCPGSRDVIREVFVRWFREIIYDEIPRRNRSVKDKHFARAIGMDSTQFNKKMKETKKMAELIVPVTERARQSPRQGRRRGRSSR